MDLSSNALLQNIFRCYESQLKSKPLPLKHLKALEAIVNCRTERAGYSIYQCPKEDTLTKHCHSCRHRSCWLCAFKQRDAWIEKQRRRLLDCSHFHTVFTLPHEYLNIWRYNQRWFTKAMFASVNETLSELMSDKRYHGVMPGMLMVLHTWGRQLTLHPHIHCLVTGGGVDDKGQWQETGAYLLPIRVVKALYRGKLQGKIMKAFESAELVLPPDHTDDKFHALYKHAYGKGWSVRIEEQYSTGRGVMLYLSRYMKGGPLNPRQIKRCDNDRIEFSYKDHRDKRSKLLTLKPKEFLRRLLSHVPESGQHNVRHYGLYSSASRDKRNQCREIVGGLTETIENEPEKKTITCSSCGTTLRRLYSSQDYHGKGNSHIESKSRFFVQQIVEAYLGVSEKPMWSGVMRV